MKTTAQILEYIDDLKAGYKDDPADTEYQEGYLDSALDLEDFIKDETE